MKKKFLIPGLVGVVLFIVFTILVCTVDRQAIGLNGTMVGFATMNKWFQDLHPANITLYKVSDWMSLAPIASGLVFAVIGIIQWVQRKKLRRVDFNLIALGILYIVLFIFFIVFKYIPINYRPVFAEPGKLETSYPSSTTLLSIGFLVAGIINNYVYIDKKPVAHAISGVELALMIFLVVSRIISRVHWLSDIIASLILGVSVSLIYISVFQIKLKDKR